MRTAILRAAAILAASLMTSVAVLTPAQADTRTFRDKGGRLTTVKVTHGGTNVTVAANVGPMEIGSYFTFWLDTNARNAGPEYKTEVYPNSDGLAVLRVGSFSDKGTAIRCDGFRASADVFGPEVVTIKVPRSCIGNPGRVRVAVRAYYEVPGPNVIDWGPARRQFFGWVYR